MGDMKETVAVITVEGASGGGHAGGGSASEQLTAIDWTDDGQLFYVATHVGHTSQLLVYLSRLAVVYSRCATRFACLTGLREIAVVDVVDQVLLLLVFLLYLSLHVPALWFLFFSCR